jgi:small subunit ribosomal protein S20
MPHHKSAGKRVKTNEKARLGNVAIKSRVRSAVKAVRAATTRTQAQVALKTATSTLDRAVAKGVMKPQTARRQESRLALFTAKVPA